MEYPIDLTFSWDERAVVPTTHGLTSAIPSAGSINTTVTSTTNGTALRMGAIHGAPIEPSKKYDPDKTKYAKESARRNPSRSAIAPPKIARNHTNPPKSPARLVARSVGKLSASCR